MKRTYTFDIGKFAVALTILFIGLKIFHTIDWNWFWILSPIIFIAAITIFIILPLIMYTTRQERSMENELEKISQDINKALKKQKDENYR